MIGQTAIDARLAEALRQADDEDHDREQHDTDPDIERDIVLDAVDGQRGGRITEQEQANQADPQHPPGYGVAAPFVRCPAAQGANRPGRQVEEDGQECGGGQRQAVFADIVLGQPQRQRHERAEHEGVGQAKAPHSRIDQGQQLLAQGRAGAVLIGPFLVQRVGIGEEPEQHGHRHHGDGVNLGHHLPGAGGSDDQRGDELGQRRPGVAGAENAHRRALPFLAEPGRGVGDADRERTTGQPDEQAQDQVVPVLGGVGDEPGRNRHQEHLDEEHDPPTVAVGQEAQRQAHQRAGQDRGGHQQAEFGFVEIQFSLDLDPNDGKHDPHGEIHREGHGVHRQHGNLFLLERSHCGPRENAALAILRASRINTLTAIKVFSGFRRLRRKRHISLVVFYFLQSSNCIGWIFMRSTADGRHSRQCGMTPWRYPGIPREHLFSPLFTKGGR